MKFYTPLFTAALCLSLVSACGGSGESTVDNKPPTAISYTVTANAGNGGSISPASLSVTAGNTASFTLSNDAGYRVDSITGCNGTLDSMTYTTAAIHSGCSISVSFAPAQPAVAVIDAVLVQQDNSTLQLSAANSSTHEAFALTYQWQLVTDTNTQLALADADTAFASIAIADLMEDTVVTAKLTVTDSAGQTAQAEQKITLQNADHNHNVIVRVVRVTEDWMPYASTDGWTQAVVRKESDFVKYFEVAIWEETLSVHLYAFPNDYDGTYGLLPNVTDAEKIAYREQHLLLQINGMPSLEHWQQRQPFLISAFDQIHRLIVQAYPHSDHHFMYNGHGGPGGELFEGMLQHDGAEQLLAAYQQSLGRKLGVIDMGGPCNKGSYSDLAVFCNHARYYIASDLENGGYQFDNWSYEQYLATDPEYQYHFLFAEQRNLGDILEDRIDNTQLRYEYAKNDMISKQLMQANYLYSCDKFASFKPDFTNFMAHQAADYSLFDDLKHYLFTNQAEDALLSAFEQVIMHQANNKAFFLWPAEHNGMLMPAWQFQQQAEN